MNERATEYDLNKSQLEQLIDMYITTVVDSMSLEDLQYYVTNNMAEFMHELTFSSSMFISLVTFCGADCVIIVVN